MTLSAGGLVLNGALQMGQTVNIKNNTCDSTYYGAMLYDQASSSPSVCTPSGWVAIGGGTPIGAIMAFNLTACPAGWTEYTASRGAFLRGIDNGAGRDPGGTRSPGSYVGDTLASHTHGVNDPGHSHMITWSQSGWGGVNMNGSYLSGIDDNRGGEKSLGSSVSTTGITIQATGSSETAPKNVAVLFCSKN